MKTTAQKQNQATQAGARFAPVTEWNYTLSTQEAAAKIGPGTVSEASHRSGMLNAEPLIVLMDGLLKYANCYAARFEAKLVNDYVLGPEWLAAAKGVRGLLNGDGAVAMNRRISTDSKDNGAVESVFWSAMEAAGFTESDL